MLYLQGCQQILLLLSKQVPQGDCENTVAVGCAEGGVNVSDGHSSLQTQQELSVQPLEEQ